MPSRNSVEGMEWDSGSRGGPDNGPTEPSHRQALTWQRCFLKYKGEQKCRESADSCGRMGVDFSPMVFNTWGGLHGAAKEAVKAMFTRCTAQLLPSARPAAVGALRQGLSVQLGRSLARQLEALMMLSTETPAWWAAALPPTPAFTAAGKPQWWVMGRVFPASGTLLRYHSCRITPPSYHQYLPATRTNLFPSYLHNIHYDAHGPRMMRRSASRPPGVLACMGRHV